jgi:hypothetical protein
MPFIVGLDEELLLSNPFDALAAKKAASSRLTSRNLGESADNRPFTPLLESTSCGNRPVRRATFSIDFRDHRDKIGTIWPAN